MVKFVVPFCFALFGLLNMVIDKDISFEELWSQVTEYEKARKPRSAHEVVDKILSKAREEKNNTQETKASIHKAKYLRQSSEDGFDLSRQFIEEQIQGIAYPHKAILHQAYAISLQQYLQTNYYQISQRKQLQEKIEDVKNWSFNLFIEEILTHLELSLSNAESCNKDVSDYKDLLQKYDAASTKYYPSLYDALLKASIELLEHQMLAFVKPKDAFQLNSANLFSPAQEFMVIEFPESASIDSYGRILKIYQSALKWSIEKNHNHAIANYDLSRLVFVNKHYSGNEQFKLYKDALQIISKDYEQTEILPSIVHELMRLEYNRAMSKTYEEQIASEDPMPLILKSLRLMSKEYPETKGGQACANLFNQIQNKNLNINYEQVVLPEEPILVNVSSQNIAGLKYELYKLDDEMLTSIRQDRSWKNVKRALGNKPYYANEISIKNGQLYYPVNSEFTIPSAKAGRYMIVVMEEDGSRNSDCVFYGVLQVSRLAYFISSGTELIEMITTNRKSGQAIAGVNIDIFKNYYDRQARKQQTEFYKSVLSDSSGKVDLTDLGDDRDNYRFRLTHGDDILDFENYERFYYRKYNNQSRIEYLIFTDRAIYRPAQTIHYKIVAIQKDGKGVPQILPGHNFTAIFKDANHQFVAENKHTSSEFGSVSGIFTAPSNGLKGQFSISIDHPGHAYRAIRIEEYKRPQFFVEMDSVKSTYRLNDTIQLQAKAESYSGFPLQNAKFSYSVVRTLKFPFWRHYIPQPNIESKIIAQGSGVTSKEGLINLDFIAEAEENIKIGWDPNYHFKVELSVTDINGETQFTNDLIRVSTQPFYFDLDLPKVVDLGKIGQFSFSTKNYANAGVNSSGSIELYKRRESSFGKRKRYWTKPNQHVSPESITWVKEVYGEEDASIWELEPAVVLNYNYEVESSQSVFVEIPSEISSGQYKVVFSGTSQLFPEDEVIFQTEINIINWSKNEFSKDKLFYYHLDKKDYKVGDSVKLNASSSIKHIPIYYRIEKSNESSVGNWLKLDGSDIYIPVEKDDLGGFGIHISYVYENRFYQEYIDVPVSWKHKEISIKYETFRDVLKAGDTERLTLKIKTTENEQLPIEYLVSMYDASLDQFITHDWKHLARNLYPSFRPKIHTRAIGFQQQWMNRHGVLINNNIINNDFKHLLFPSIDYSPLVGSYHRPGIVRRSMQYESAPYAADGMAEPAMTKGQMADESSAMNESMEADQNIDLQSIDDSKTVDSKPELRKNLNELAFFYPDLYTDEEGNLSYTFTLPESFTEWKILSFAHDKKLNFGFDEQKLKTQKDLMIVPNVPRFLRQNDELKLEAKVINMLGLDQDAYAYLEIFNPITGKQITQSFGLNTNRQSFNIAANSSSTVNWLIKVPADIQDLIELRYYVETNNSKDGEAHTLPVLIDRILVTETKPFFVSPNSNKEVLFDNFNSNSSESLSHHKYVLEYSANPTWYAIQALPYLMEEGRPNAIRLVNRYFANLIAAQILNSHPKLKAVFDKWRALESEAFLSELEKNQSLKTALLNETPWVMSAKNEQESKKRIGVLFDLNKVKNDSKAIIEKLEQMQLYGGAFPWFEGGYENEYVTRYVLQVLAQAKKMTNVQELEVSLMNKVLNVAITYLDKQIAKKYNFLLEKKANLEADHLNINVLHILYTRSFYDEIELSKNSVSAYDFYKSQVLKYGNDKSIIASVLSAFILARDEQYSAAKEITESLTERSFYSEHLGRYWNYGDGYSWHDMPIENQAMAIELFVELGESKKIVSELKQWLLFNKQTNHWKTDKATCSAIYALLVSGENEDMSPVIKNDSRFKLSIGDTVLDQDDSEISGISYVKKEWHTEEINSGLSSLEVSNNSDHIAWGALYWQYFEDISSVKAANSGSLNLRKQLYKQVSTDKGKELELITAQTKLSTGDQIVVRLELSADRSMEFVHLKDSRASAMEPLSHLSMHKWSNGLYYYESPSDLATDFFIDYLPKGQYVFEYNLVVANEGKLSSGVATIQCLYAPEFSAHSSGTTVEIK